MVGAVASLVAWFCVTAFGSCSRKLSLKSVFQTSHLLASHFTALHKILLLLKLARKCGAGFQRVQYHRWHYWCPAYRWPLKTLGKMKPLNGVVITLVPGCSFAWRSRSPDSEGSWFEQILSDLQDTQLVISDKEVWGRRMWVNLSKWVRYEYICVL